MGLLWQQSTLRPSQRPRLFLKPSQTPLLTPSPTTLLATATQVTVMATTERDRLMPRLRLSQRLGTMAATAMDGLHMATATTERGRPMPSLSPTTTATPPTAMVATTERGPL